MVKLLLISTLLICFNISIASADGDLKNCSFSGYVKWYKNQKSKGCGKLRKLVDSPLQKKREKYIQKKYKSLDYSKYMKHRTCISETFNNLRKLMNEKCFSLDESNQRAAENNSACKANLTKSECHKYDEKVSSLNQSIELSASSYSSRKKSYEDHSRFKACIELKLKTLASKYKATCHAAPAVSAPKALWKQKPSTNALKNVSFMCPPGRHLQGLNHGNPVCN